MFTPIKSDGGRQIGGCAMYDMHGNAWEWCNDCYARYPAGEAVDPTGPAQGDSISPRVLRGGVWVSLPQDCRAACRGWSAPGDRAGVVGFRCLMDLP